MLLLFFLRKKEGKLDKSKLKKKSASEVDTFFFLCGGKVYNMLCCMTWFRFTALLGLVIYTIALH